MAMTNHSGKCQDLNGRVALLLGLTLVTALIPALSAQTAPTLGVAQSFAVLGGSAVTNTGATVITGDLGVSPGTSITGFPPGIVNGTIHQTDAVAAQAQADSLTAYNSLAGQACSPSNNLTGMDLGGKTLTAGVYCFSSSAQLTGTLTLDAQGNPNSVFIFQIGSTLTTASNSAIVMINSGVPCNVYFQIGSSATLGTGTQFLGNIFAYTSISVNTNATIEPGRAIALNGAVTLDSNVISVAACNSGSVEICVAASSTPGTYSFNVPSATPPQSTSVTVAAGSCSAPILVPSGTATITETLPNGTSLTGVYTSPSSALLVSSNLGAGTATVTVSPGGLTTVTFINGPTPTPGTGLVQVCKVAGAGVSTGTTFAFSVGGNSIPLLAAGPAPGGTCSAPVQVAAGTVSVEETTPANTAVAGVSTQPSASLLGSVVVVPSTVTLPGSTTATVTVNSGAQTIVTFIDTVPIPTPGMGFVQVCKVAGPGVTVGTTFAFTVAGNTIPALAAGAAPGGTCSAPVAVTAGSVAVAETVPTGTVLASVTTLPSAGLLVSSNLAAGTATVTVTSGGQTIVTFTDEVPVVLTTGFLQICKVAENGLLTGMNFTFDVAGTPLTVAAGAGPVGICSPVFAEPSGTVAITETLPADVLLKAVTTLPAAGLLVSSDLTTGTANVTVSAGVQTIATFTDGVAADVFQIGISTNLGQGNSYLNFTNTGAFGNLCVNVYAFDSQEEMISCCSCLVTPNGLNSLSAQQDLASNTLTPGVPGSLVIKLLASAPSNAGTCNAASPTVSTLEPGLLGWATSLHQNTGTGTYQTTENVFQNVGLSPSELAKLTSYCGFIKATGSGYGICKSCQTGGLGAVNK